MEKILSCESEKLHLINSIQEFGALLAINKETSLISHVSENIEKVLQLSPEVCLHSPPPQEISEFIKLILDTENQNTVEIINIHDKQYIVKTVSVEKYFILEFLFEDIHKKKFFSNSTPELYIHPNSEETLIKYANNFSNILLDVLDIEKVMIYKYLEDWSGEVIAESCKPNSDLGEYIGLRFPSSDIPKIARDLYKINEVRQIADVNYTPIKILSSSNDILDLTRSQLRSVSKMHITYLKNMGVQSSISFKISFNDKLWGLVACHDSKKKVIATQVIEKTKKIIRLFEIGIHNYYTNKSLFDDDVILSTSEKFSINIHKSDNIKNFIISHEAELLQKFKANGLCFFYNDEMSSLGNIPDNESIKEILKYIFEKDLGFFQTQNIIAELSSSNQYIGPPGILGINIKSSSQNLCLLFFRDHTEVTINWAGNPNKSMENVDGMGMINPRNSFEKWVEKNHSSSTPWEKVEKNLALSLIPIFRKHL